MKARFRRSIAALGALALSLVGTAAHAASAAQPGQTLGLPTGAQLPIGLILLDTSSFGIRDTSPVQSESNINLPGVVWVPGVHVFGGRLHLIYIQPVVAARSAATRAASACRWSRPSSPGSSRATSTSATCSAATCRSTRSS